MLFKVLSVEEEDITSIAIAPGIVDTSMQKIIREKGERKSRLLFLCDGKVLIIITTTTILLSFH